ADEPYDEALGKGYRAPPKKSDESDPKPVWVHAWKVDHGGNFLNTTIDGEIGSRRRTCIWSLSTSRRRMTKYREMSCGGPWRSTKSQLSTLPSLRICTRMRRRLSGHVMATPLIFLLT